MRNVCSVTTLFSSDNLIQRINLSKNEINTIKSLVSKIASRYDSVEDPDWLHETTIYADGLPIRVRKCLNDFRLRKSASAVCVISNYPVNDLKIGKTPSHWKNRSNPSPTLEQEILFVLFTSLLGEPYSLSTEQDGHIVNDIFPIKGDEYKQIATASEQIIKWHTEDAFLTNKPDYLGLMCLRNPGKVATTFASINKLDLEPGQISVLFEPRFIFFPDESNSQANTLGLEKQLNNSVSWSKLVSYERKIYPEIKPQKLPVLFGDPQFPYISIDPHFMSTKEKDEKARLALNALIQLIEARLSEFILQPGDCCFIDNYRAVHGRNSFNAKYNGYDRWLKRIRITKDLRKWR